MDKLEPINSREAADPKRRARRASTFLQAEVRYGEHAPVQLRVRNLSAGGMMVDWVDPPAVGTTVDASLRGIDTVGGQVAWVKPGQVGISFDEPINPEAVRKPVIRSVSADRLMPPEKNPNRRPSLR